jgi:hypothetical protein
MNFDNNNAILLGDSMVQYKLLNPVTREQDPYPLYVGPFGAKLQPLPPDSNPNKIILTYEKDFSTPNPCTNPLTPIDPLLCTVDGIRRPC